MNTWIPRSITKHNGRKTWCIYGVGFPTLIKAIRFDLTRKTYKFQFLYHFQQSKNNPYWWRNFNWWHEHRRDEVNLIYKFWNKT